LSTRPLEYPYIEGVEAQKNVTMVKRGSVLVCVLLAGLAAGASADAVSDSWTRVYRRASTLEQRYQIMQSIVVLDNPDLIPLLTDSLGALLDVREPRTANEQMQWDSLTRSIVVELGDLGAKDAGPAIYRVVAEAKSSLVRSDAMLSLGRVGATAYADEIALLLRNLVLLPGTLVEADEALAYGSIVALEALHQEVGYSPVFAASHARFSDWITRLAAASLPKMLSDPTNVLERIVCQEQDSALGIQALRLGIRSEAPAAAKARLATTTLEQGLFRTADPAVKAAGLRLLRLEALVALASLGNEGVALPAGVVQLGERVLARDPDLAERLAAVDTLQAEGSDDAALALTAYLVRWNNRQESGLSAPPDQIRVVTAVVQALGTLGSASAFPELVRTQTIHTWQTSVIREANAAAQALDRVK
jgi:hypothetical protein